MNRLPNWLRWLLFLPISIIASISVYLLVKFLCSIFESFFLFQFLLILPGAGLTGYIFAEIAAKLVPKYNFAFSILMALTYAILVGIFLTNKATAIKIIHLTSFEIICLIVVGSIGAVVACYHTYKYQKRIASELDDLINVGQDNLSSKKIGENDEISKIKSEAFEKQVFHIISKFDSGTVEGDIKHITKEKLGSRLPSADESSEIYQDRSLRPNVQEEVIIGESAPSDLEKEVLGVVSKLDSEIGESTGKLSSPVYQRKHSTVSTKPVDNIYRAESSRQQKAREVKHIPSSDSNFSESKELQSSSKLLSTLKQPNSKERINDELQIKTGKPNVASDPVQSETLNQEPKQEKPVPQLDLKVSDRQTSRTSGLYSEKKLHKRKPIPKVNRLTHTVKSSNLRDVSPNDLSEQKLSEAQYIGRNDQRSSEPEAWQTSFDLVPEITKSNNEIITEDDLLIGLTETDESTDALLEELFEQELQPEQYVPNKEFEDTAKELLEQPVKSVPEIIESKREVKSENNRSRGPIESEKSSDALAEDFSKQEWKEEKHVLDADSMDFKGGYVQRPFKSMSEIVESKRVTISTDEDSTETNQVIEYYEEEVFPSEFDKDEANAKLDSRELDDRIKKTELNLPPDENSPKQTNEDDIFISLDEIDELINRYQDDSFLKEFIKNKNIPTPEKEEPAASSLESIKILNSDQEDSFLRKFVEENKSAFLDLKDSEREILQTTTELNFLITESQKNQFTKIIQDFFISKDNDQKVALINTEIYYLWCMMVTIFDFSIDSDFRKKLIQFFNSRTISLYLKWKGFTNSGTSYKKSIDFNNFTYYSNQLRANRIYLNSSFQNTEGEILFGKIVFAKILENMGDRKINLDRNAILMPVQAYYELKQRVIEILNNSTETICI